MFAKNIVGLDQALSYFGSSEKLKPRFMRQKQCCRRNLTAANTQASLQPQHLARKFGRCQEVLEGTFGGGYGAARP